MDTVPRFAVWVSERDGRTVVVKTGSGPAAVAALEREAAALRALRHPGVVDLIGLERAEVDRTPWAQLSTRFAGTHTLHTVPATSALLTVFRAGQMLATLAALHGRGLVHGAVDPGHIVVDPAGGAKWCSLGATRPASAAERLQEARATVPLVVADLTAARRIGPRRRRTDALLEAATAAIAGADLDAVAMASALTRLLSTLPVARPGATPRRSAEADRNLVGEQASGDRQDQVAPLRDHQTVEHPRDLRW